MKKTNKLGRSTKAKVFRPDTEEDKKRKVSLTANSEGSGFSGSAYNAKGNADHGKTVSNKKRR